MCNPDDDEPCIDGTPSQAASADTRSAGQRHHDALLAAPRALLASGELGQHNGLPASIIVTTTLHELEAGAGKALTGGGTLLPMSRCDPAGLPCPPLPGDLRQRQSAGALSHQTAGLTGPANCAVRQRPRLPVPRLHRARLPLRSPPRNPYATNPVTDINDLTLACGPNHKLADQGWTTRKNAHGDTEWIPPAAPRPRPTPHQHLPPPRKTATRTMNSLSGPSR